MSLATELRHWEGAPVERWRERWRLPALQVLDRCGSTNDLIRAAAMSGAAAGTAALAEYQTSGRGRLGRTWQAPAGTALLLSVLIRPGPGGAAEAAGALTLRVGLAVADAIGEQAGITVALKWPNDVLVAGAKVAGILCEAAGDFVVVGMGLNAGQQAEDFPDELAGYATSLLLATGRVPDRAALAGSILDRLRPLFTAPHRPLNTDELAAFAALDTLRGRTVLIGDQAAGTAAGIDPLGGLLVEQAGTRHAVYAGTVRSIP